jgi:hypothetical protein
MVDPQELMPLDPPSTDAAGCSVSPISSLIASIGQRSASAAICVKAVHVPVPISAAPMRTS